MTRKTEQNETSETMQKLQNVRLELKKIETDIQENRQRQEEVRKAYTTRNDTDEAVVRAEAYLENQGIPGSSFSFEEESRQLADKAAVLKKAHQIKNAELEKLVILASQELKKSVMSDFISCLEKKFRAIGDYEQAWKQEIKIREGFTDKGLRNVLPFIDWPGMQPVNFNQQRQTLRHRLAQMGLADFLK